MDIETAVGELHRQRPLHAGLMFFLSLGWNGSDCVSRHEAAPRTRRWNDKSTPWSRHPASENGTQQRCRGLFSVSQHVLEEDEIETDSCKSSSLSVSFQHSSSIVGAVQQNPKSTNYTATITSCKVRRKLFYTEFMHIIKVNLASNLLQFFLLQCELSSGCLFYHAGHL